MDACERYSKRAIEERAKLQDVAPKDVKQLEVLRPVNTPSMGERYKNLIEKEKRLEASTRPVQKHSESKQQAPENESSKAKKKKASAPKRKKETSTAENNLADNESSLLEEDEVKEGIDWSDDDEGF